MSANEVYGALMKQADFAFNSFNTRRDYEWKISLGLWGLIALSTQFAFSNFLPVRWWMLILIALGVVFLHGLWLHGSMEGP